MNFDLQEVRAIARVIKQRFPNLTVDETLALAGDILEAQATVRGSKST